MNRRTFIGMLGLGAGAVASGVAVKEALANPDEVLYTAGPFDPAKAMAMHDKALNKHWARSNGEFTEADCISAFKKMRTSHNPSNTVLYMSMGEYERNWAKEFPLVGRE